MKIRKEQSGETEKAVLREKWAPSPTYHRVI